MKTEIDMQVTLQNILEIDVENSFLKYICNRIQRKNYRGWHISQHNRYDIEDIKIILKSIKAIVDGNYFAIPSGDYDKDHKFDSNSAYNDYQEIIKAIYSEIGRGTINSIKKNFFPDLEKMGFLIREKVQIAEGKVWHGKLSNEAFELVEAKSVIDRFKKYTDGIDKLFENKISELAEIIYLSDYVDDTISIYEFMFIFSDKDEAIDKIGLLSSYRSLGRYQQNDLISYIKSYANPSNFSGTKTRKRDFHNWKNQAQQIISLLKTTVYFEAEKDKFKLNFGGNGFFEKPTARSAKSKHDYFKFHNLDKKFDFELHHIIPISAARNKKEFKMIDDHRNLIYIDRLKHKQLTDRHIVLEIDSSSVSFVDTTRDFEITVSKDQDALYSADQIKNMLEYNAKLLKVIFDYDK